jgi:hypothetical protein
MYYALSSGDAPPARDWLVGNVGCAPAPRGVLSTTSSSPAAREESGARARSPERIFVVEEIEGFYDPRTATLAAKSVSSSAPHLKVPSQTIRLSFPPTVSCRLCTVTFHANLAHSLTRSP